MAVFISHSERDKMEFQNLVDFLDRESIPHWSTESMSTGALLADQLREAISKSEVCIFVATRNSIASAWCGAELGAFWGSGKPVLIYVSDPSLKGGDLPKQFKGHLYERRTIKIVKAAKKYLLPVDNFGGKIPDEDFVVLYLSTGGTCRCAMANLITRHQLKSQHPDNRIKSISAGLVNPELAFMTPTAKRVCQERLKLSSIEHKSIQANRALYRRANLILSFEKRLISVIPLIDEQSKYKARPFSEFFCGKGDIFDPWKRDIRAYQECFQELYDRVVPNIDVLIRYAEDR